MLKKDAIAFYGTLSELSRALGVDKAAVSRWRHHVPLKRAMQLEVMTKGKLRCNINEYLARQ